MGATSAGGRDKCKGPEAAMNLMDSKVRVAEEGERG